jgi:hypothetical protein
MTNNLAAASIALFAATVVRAENLRIENVRVAPRDAKTATVTFDIGWSNSWRHGSFHDAAWVFFKVQADDKTGWQPMHLVADPPSPGTPAVANPKGFGQAEGTPLEFVVPADKDGAIGMFVRRAADGKGAVAAREVTAVVALNTAIRRLSAGFRACGIEMVYVPAGPFYLGSGPGGREINRFSRWTGDGEETAPYRVTHSSAIPTGRQEGRLWATGIAPPDNGEIPAAFPNGYSAFYVMKYFITQGQYADFLSTLTEAQAKARYYEGIHGRAINRSGKPPSTRYSASAPDRRLNGLSWSDGAAFAAWAGLRPMTELEYEKAIRGPQDRTPNDNPQSYCGIPDMNGDRLYERPVSVGNAVGLAFKGTHGCGTPALPADWPKDGGGAIYRGDFLFMRSYNFVGHLLISGRSNANSVHADRGIRGFAGWRGARSAPAGDLIAGQPLFRIDPTIVRPVARLIRPVRADSVPEDWGAPLATLNSPADIFPTYNRFIPWDGRAPWQGPGDMSAKVYLGWDGEALCVGSVVTDDRHVNTSVCDGICNGDSLRVGLITATGTRWDVALALTTNGVAIHQFAGADDTLLKTADCAVARDDKAAATRYGLRLPLGSLGLKPGEKFGFHVTLSDADGDSGLRYRMELAPDVSSSFNPDQYAQFVLEK